MLAFTVYLNQLIFTVQDGLDKLESAGMFMQSISKKQWLKTVCSFILGEAKQTVLSVQTI